MNDLIDDLMAGPDKVRKVFLPNGKFFYARAGSLSERNKAEELFSDHKTVMAGIAWVLWSRLSDEYGNALFKDRKFRDYAKELDYDVATVIATAIKKLDGSDDSESEDGSDARKSIDQMAADQIKN